LPDFRADRRGLSGLQLGSNPNAFLAPRPRCRAGRSSSVIVYQHDHSPWADRVAPFIRSAPDPQPQGCSTSSGSIEFDYRHHECPTNCQRAIELTTSSTRFSFLPSGRPSVGYRDRARRGPIPLHTADPAHHLIRRRSLTRRQGVGVVVFEDHGI
jgi:hypothetical protein